MHDISTDILVIGGGATGAGIVRDIAMRGFKTILVEKADLAHGTSGRYHGLLHSGGRYVVKDPHAAKECIQENLILRKIMPHCIEDTGGFFVFTPDDNLEYSPKFKEGCKIAGIPFEEVPLKQMLREEPLLNPNITLCYRVPDGAADSFLAAEANITSAKEYKAEIIRYAKIINLLLNNDQIIGAQCLNVINSEEFTISCSMVINAAGAWAGKIASLAGIEVNIVAGKGTMLATNHRLVNKVINRCKMPSDGDILVPAHTVSIIGTTDIRVPDPDQYPIEPWEVNLLLDEGDKLIPGFRNMRMLRSWAGVRPLYQESNVNENRDVPRAFVLLDHATRDGIEGLVTITSGKWTTYRKMAEKTSDLVCEKLGVKRECRTHLELLPAVHSHGYHQLGQRLAKIEREKDFGKLICECELATQQDVMESITLHDATTIDDIRRDVRLGMGPCQGGFCTLRAAGILNSIKKNQVSEINVALRDYLQERWKGVLPILWGQQLRQERLNELIYISLLNADHLPGKVESNLSPIPYSPPTTTPVIQVKNLSDDDNQKKENHDLSNHSSYSDVLVIGAGMGGLAAALKALENGLSTKIISKGWGTMHWHTGCIDLIGYSQINNFNVVTNPRKEIEKIINTYPSHPYTLSGLKMIEASIDAFINLSKISGIPYHGTLENNYVFPTSIGTIRPTCLAPESMIGGNLNNVSNPDEILIVGFEQFLDFYPHLIANNLGLQGFNAKGIIINLASLRNEKLVSGRFLANKFDEDEEFQAEVVKTLKMQMPTTTRVGFPAVLGFSNVLKIKKFLEDELGVPIFEIPTLPPSIPGIQLHTMFTNAIERLGGKIFPGMQVLSTNMENQTVVSVQSETSSRPLSHSAKFFVLATGGILGGGIQTNSVGENKEIIFNLLLPSLEYKPHFEPQFLNPKGHQIYKTGVLVDDGFRPFYGDRSTSFNNLFVCGNSLGSFDPIRERSLEGTALATGYTIGSNLLDHNNNH